MVRAAIELRALDRVAPIRSDATDLLHSLVDEESFFFELPGLHLFAHPARGRTTSGPCQIRVLLAAVLRSNFAALSFEPRLPGGRPRPLPTLFPLVNRES